MVDHSRLAYSEIHSDEKGPTCAGFMARAAQYIHQHGISRIERIITDNHFSYRRSAHVAKVIEELTARHLFIKSHCPWQNGEVERYNRTLQKRMVLPAGLHLQHRPRPSTCTLGRVLQHSTWPQRTRWTTTHQPPAINLMTEYTPPLVPSGLRFIPGCAARQSDVPTGHSAQRASADATTPRLLPTAHCC